MERRGRDGEKREEVEFTPFGAHVSMCMQYV